LILAQKVKNEKWLLLKVCSFSFKSQTNNLNKKILIKDLQNKE